MGSSFETHRFAMLLRMRSQTLMVRSASLRVSNHEATGGAASIRANRKMFKCGNLSRRAEVTRHKFCSIIAV